MYIDFIELYIKIVIQEGELTLARGNNLVAGVYWKYLYWWRRWAIFWLVREGGRGQGFINYNILQNRFSSMSMLVKKQRCMSLITTWYDSRNCTKVVLKPLPAKKWPSYFTPVYCSFFVDYTISVYMMTTLHFYTLCNLIT